MRKIAVSLFLIVSILLAASSVDARDYWLDRSSLDITVDSSGAAHVQEKLYYSFSGEYNEVYRDVFYPEGGELINTSGFCENSLCEYYELSIVGGTELVGKLARPMPDKVVFVTSYTYLRGVKVHDDLSQLHFKLWGEEWEKPLGKLEATISLPYKEGIEYWMHPEGIAKVVQQGDKLFVTAENLPSNQYLEIRVVFPKLENAYNANIVPGMAREEILKYERTYKVKKAISEYLVFIPLTLILLLLMTPIFVYIRYGREPKTGYSMIYEREPPTKTKPAVVNSLMNFAFGYPTISAFTSTFMDLVNRGFFSISDVKTNKKFLGIINREQEDMLISLNSKKDTSALLPFELKVYAEISGKMEKDQILWSQLKEKLGKGTGFYTFLSSWYNDVREQAKADAMFIRKGNTIMMLSGVACILLSMVGIWAVNLAFSATEYPDSVFTTLAFIALIILSIAIIIFSAVFPRVFGRYTPEGMVFNQKWKSFRKYLTDFSAMKQHPPASITIWNDYMVYAVALGVAEKVQENMELLVNKKDLNQISTHRTAMFVSGFNTAYTSSMPRSSGRGGGGVGGSGGGFGGGGGGAR